MSQYIYLCGLLFTDILLMRFVGMIFKYLLWSVFSIIVFLLLIGLAKTHRNVSKYLDVLNSNDRSSFEISQPNTWIDPFFPMETQETSIDDVFSDESLINNLSGDLDVYDPAFEDDINTLPQDDMLDQEEDFGFTTDVNSVDTHPASDEASILREFVEQRNKQ